MAATEVFSNNPSTTVTSGGTDAPAGGTSESWTVASAAEFPGASTGVTQFHAGDPAQPSEIILVTNVSGTSWTVTRGAESSTPVAHTPGFTVYQIVTAGWLNGVDAGLVTINSTAANIQPAGVAAAGTIGTVPDTGHVHPDYALLNLYTAPAGATAETFPRTMCTGTGTPSSGRLQAAAIPLPAGTPVNSITFAVGTAFGGVTHGWYALLDSGGTVRAVTSDQASPTWGTGSIPVTLSVAASAYTTTYSGLYYAGWMVAAGTVGTMAIAGNLSGGLSAAAPILCGTSGSGLTTPPAAGSAFTITANNFWSLYAYTS